MSRAALLLVCCSTLMGCIITRDPGSPPRRNTPPVVLDDPSQLFTEFIDVQLDLGTAPDGGVGNPYEIVASVRDPDIEDRLQGLVFLDRNPDSTNTPELEFVIPASTMETRSVRQPYDFTELQVGCHVLELHVSRGFVGFTNPEPAPDPDYPDAPPDLGRGIWFVRVHATEDDIIELRGCGR